MKSSFRIYVVLITILILEASASPYLNLPRQSYAHKQRNIPSPEYQGEVQANLYRQPQASRGLKSNLYGPGSSFRRQSFYPSPLTAVQASAQSTGSGSSDSPISVLHIPLPTTSSKTTKIQLPLATDTSKFTLLHVNPLVAKDGFAESSKLSSDVLESVSHAESLLSNIESDSNAYREIKIGSNRKPLSTKGQSFSSAKATSTALSDSENRSSGYYIYPQYNGNQGAAYGQTENSNRAASTAQATSSSFENQFGTNINLLKNYLRKDRNHEYGNQGAAFTQTGLINAAQAVASVANSFKSNSINNNNFQYTNQGLAPTQPQISSSASQATASAINGINSGGGSFSVHDSDQAVHLNEENQGVASTLPIASNSDAQAVAGAASSSGSQDTFDDRGSNPINSYDQEYRSQGTAASQTGTTYGASQAVEGALNGFKTQSGTNNNRGSYSMNNYNRAYRNKGALPSQLGISYNTSPVAAGIVNGFQNQGETYGRRVFNPLNYLYQVNQGGTASDFENQGGTYNDHDSYQGIASSQSGISNSAAQAIANALSGFNSQGESYGVPDSNPKNDLNQGIAPTLTHVSNSAAEAVASDASNFDSNSINNNNLRYYNQGIAPTQSGISNSASQTAANALSSVNSQSESYGIPDSNPIIYYNQENKGILPIASNSAQALASSSSSGSQGGIYDNQGLNPMNNYYQEYISQGTAPSQTGKTYSASQAAAGAIDGLSDSYNSPDSSMNNYNNAYINQGTAPFQRGRSYYAIPDAPDFVKGFKSQGRKYSNPDSDLIDSSIQDNQGVAPIEPVISNSDAQAIANAASGFESLGGEYNDRDSYLINQGTTPSEQGISYSASQTAADAVSDYGGENSFLDFNPLNYFNEESRDSVQTGASDASRIVTLSQTYHERDSDYGNTNQDTAPTQTEISDSTFQAAAGVSGFKSQGGTYYGVLDTNSRKYFNQDNQGPAPNQQINSNSAAQAVAGAASSFRSQEERYANRGSDRMNIYDLEYINGGTASSQLETSYSASQADASAEGVFKSQSGLQNVYDSTSINQETGLNTPINSYSAAQAQATAASGFESQGDQGSNPMNRYDDTYINQGAGLYSPINSNSAAQAEANADSGFASQGDQESSSMNSYDDEYINQVTSNSQLEISHSSSQAAAGTVNGFKRQNGTQVVYDSTPLNQGVGLNLPINSNSAAQDEANAASDFESQSDHDSNPLNDYDDTYINQGTEPSQQGINYNASDADTDAISGIKSHRRKHIVLVSGLNDFYQESQGIAPNSPIISNSAAHDAGSASSSFENKDDHDSNQINDYDQVYDDQRPTTPETGNGDAQNLPSTTSVSGNKKGTHNRRKPYVSFNYHRGYKTKGQSIFEEDEHHVVHKKKYKYAKNGGVAPNQPKVNSENDDDDDWLENDYKDEVPNNKNHVNDDSSNEFDNQNEARGSSKPTHSVNKEDDSEIGNIVIGNINRGDNDDDSQVSTKQNNYIFITEPNSSQNDHRVHFKRTKKPAHSTTAHTKATSKSTRKNRNKRNKHKKVPKSSPATTAAPIHSKTHAPSSGKRSDKVHIKEHNQRDSSKHPEFREPDSKESPIAPGHDQYEGFNNPNSSEQDFRKTSQHDSAYDEISGTYNYDDITKGSNIWFPINDDDRPDSSVSDDTNVPKDDKTNSPMQVKPDSYSVPINDKTSGFIDYSTDYSNSWTHDMDYSEKSKSSRFSSQNPSDYSHDTQHNPNASDLQDKESSGPTTNQFDDGSLKNEPADATPINNNPSDNPDTSISDKSSTKASLHKKDKEYKAEVIITTLRNRHSNSAETEGSTSSVTSGSAHTHSSKYKIKKPSSGISLTELKTTPSSANPTNVYGVENNCDDASTNSGSPRCRSTYPKITSSGSDFGSNFEIFGQDDVYSARFIGVLKEIYVSLQKLFPGFCNPNTDLKTDSQVYS